MAYHSKCVVTTESQMFNVKSQLERMEENISQTQEEIKQNLGRKKSKTSEETARYLQLESDIRALSHKAMEMIKSKEHILVEELKSISEKHVRQLQADISSDETSVARCQQQVERIDQVLQSESDVDVCTLYQGCEAGDAVADTDLREEDRIAKVTLRQDTDQLFRALNALQLGEIDVLYERRLDPKASAETQGTRHEWDEKASAETQGTRHALNLKTGTEIRGTSRVLDLKTTPVLLETINVRTTEDRNKALLIDVIVMIVNGTDTVIITDYSNKSVKSFYIRNDKPCYSRLSLDSDPWSLTQLTPNQIAVTVPKIKQIVIVEASPDMSRLSTISTSKQYRGITALTSSTVAVSTTSPPGVDVLDSKGNVLRSTSHIHHIPSTLKYPYFLSLTNTGNILVPDSGTKHVLCLKPDGDIVFASVPTGDSSRHGPQGIISTITGEILVTYFDLNSVVHLTETGQFVKTLLTEQHDIDKPRGLFVGGQGRVYICNSFKGQINVFQC